MTKMKPMAHTIDATNRTLGRVASEAAHALLGKRSPNYMQNEVQDIKVVIENVSKLHLPERRVKGKVYTRYTGHPGGFFKTGMKEMIIKKGIEAVVRKTVDGMIPRNKLRAPRMKNLTVKA
ncbi:MAG: uL13 family ribosomal protein [bacterium]|nr:uL13 family ribosomal protein [bacterium]